MMQSWFGDGEWVRDSWELNRLFLVHLKLLAGLLTVSIFIKNLAYTVALIIA